MRKILFASLLPIGGAKKDKARADNIMLMYNVKF